MSSKNLEAAVENINPTEPAKTRLGEDLSRLFNEQTLSDITLCVNQKMFPAHKIILCARSPVFRAMFDTDAKEKRTGIVHIEDMDADTVEKMLNFLYSDVLDVQPDGAMRLYSAADKYQIGLLKYECSSFLKSKLDVSNVLQVLVLADLHQDMDLKKSAHDFTAIHATEIFKSEAWKSFLIQNASIAADLMQVLFKDKGMICSTDKAVFSSPSQFSYGSNPNPHQMQRGFSNTLGFANTGINNRNW